MAKKAKPIAPKQATDKSAKPKAAAAKPAPAKSAKSPAAKKPATAKAAAPRAAKKIAAADALLPPATEFVVAESAVAPLTLADRYASFEDAKSATIDALLASIEAAEARLLDVKRAASFEQLEPLAGGDAGLHS